MSLRRRLVLGLLGVVGVGLLLSGIATYAALRSSLSGKVNLQLTVARQQVLSLMEQSTLTTQNLETILSLVPPDTFAILVDSVSGQVISERESAFGGHTDPPPIVPRPIPVEDLTSPAWATPTDFTTGSSGGSGVSYRAWAFELSNGDVLILAASLQSMTQTLSKLAVIEVVVSILVLTALALVARWVVRLGLRPLDDMAATADTIAAGDLSQRVDASNPETEVGRLADALNAMLAQIEAAFAERQRSEDRLRRFVADASHELRTPLTSIRGYAELFRRGASRDPEGVARGMARIENEAARMGVLVDDLLLLARLDQGRPLRTDPVDLCRLAREAVEDARVVDPGRPIDLDLSPPVVVSGDEDRLRQVAANLLSNAIGHTRRDVAVHVAVRLLGSKGLLEVSDEGPGLEPHQAERVFERFYRTDTARTRGGAGLGLSIVAAVAEAHRGRASVSSDPGHGATFTVEIPLFNGSVEQRNGVRSGDVGEAVVGS
jgi:two-component system OmpR family sensor kinase